MAMVGGSIGLTFAVSLVASPLLYQAIGMGGIFALTGILALAAIAVVVWVVPEAPMVKARRVPLGEVLRHAELMRLNLGVFALHMTQMAMFVVLPGALVQYAGPAAAGALENLSAGGTGLIRADAAARLHRRKARCHETGIRGRHQFVAGCASRYVGGLVASAGALVGIGRIAVCILCGLIF